MRLAADFQHAGQTDGWTDGQTDRPTYRDARMHLKKKTTRNAAENRDVAIKSKKGKTMEETDISMVEKPVWWVETTARLALVFFLIAI